MAWLGCFFLRVSHGASVTVTWWPVLQSFEGLTEAEGFASKDSESVLAVVKGLSLLRDGLSHKVAWVSSQNSGKFPPALVIHKASVRGDVFYAVLKFPHDYYYSILLITQISPGSSREGMDSRRLELLGTTL